MNSFEFLTAKKIICQVGASENLADRLKEIDINVPLIVTDKGLIDAGVVEQVVDPLKVAGIDPIIYSGIQPDPPEHIVLETVAFAKEHGVDAVIGLGGGSSLDVAKLIAVLLQSTQDISEIYGIGNVRGSRAPLILIPTTAGTGSEVTPISIITTGKTTKSGVVSPQLLPDLAILDAQLTVGLPPSVTASTGVDAMVHAIEAFTSKVKKNMYSDMLACKALNLMSANIEEAVMNGANLEARSNMLLGSLLAGQAFANAPVAAVHALAYPLGGNYHIPHGLSNSLVLPHVLHFNAPDASASYAGLLKEVSQDARCTSEKEGCDLFISYIENLIDRLGLPKRLSDLNVPSSDLHRLAGEAMEQQRLLINNPREVTRDDALKIYQSAY